MLAFPYPGKPREYMFDKKVKESLCMLLIKQGIRLRNATAPGVVEAEKLDAIADLIITHLDKRYPVPELAQIADEREQAAVAVPQNIRQDRL